MRVFVTGATGAIGRPLIPRLLQAGHEVTAMTRSPEKAEALRAAGVDAVVCDAFDSEGVRAAIIAARPEVLVNQLTDLPAAIDPRKYEQALQGTNRLRRETTPVLAAAARDAGARRIISQSVSFMQRPDGPRIADEDDPLWLDAPKPLTDGVASTAALEQATTQAEGIEGVVLRYGFFYGPGTAFARDGASSAEVARRRYPVIGTGLGLFSFIHIDDAAEATVLALDHGAPGILNITDDLPVAAREWIPAMAAAMGAKGPRHVPLWLAKLLVGAMALTMVTGKGASNARAREQLGWTPRLATYREGFPAVFGGATTTG